MSDRLLGFDMNNDIDRVILSLIRFMFFGFCKRVYGPTSDLDQPD